MFYKIKDVKVMDNYNLLVIFENGKNKIYDVKQIFDKWQEFKILESDDVLFSNVKVDLGGYGISWNEELDLSCNELWENGKETAN